MLFKSFFSLLALLTILSTHEAVAYDIEDYSTTDDATLEALLRANDQFILSAGPHEAALTAYRAAVLEYSLSIRISSPSGDLKLINVLEQK